MALRPSFNSGKLKDGLKATGRWYTSCSDSYNLTFRQNPEFLYNGEKYVRVCVSNYNQELPNGTLAYRDTIQWVRVEPIEFYIKNWDKLPKSINPKGHGRAQTIELESKNIIITGMPYCLDKTCDNLNLWQNSIIRAFLNGSSNQKLGKNSSFSHKHDNFDFSNGGFLQQAFNLSREPIVEYTIPPHQKSIGSYEFCGCVNLQKVIIPSHVNHVDISAFVDSNIKYLYINRTTGNMEFTQELPQDLSECIGMCELSKLTKTIEMDNFATFFSMSDLRKISKLTNILYKNNMTISDVTAKELISNLRFESFINYSDFRFFKNELKDTLVEIKKSCLMEEEKDFYKFAVLLGCFSNQRLIDKHGKETLIIMAQKASSFLAHIVKNKLIDIERLDRIVKDIPLGFEPSQEFLKFISQQGAGGELENLDMLLTLNAGGYPGVFAKVMTQFDKVKKYRTTLGPNGTPITVSWLDAITKFDDENAYYGVTSENLDIAKEMSSHGLEQEVFMEAVNLRKEAQENNIPEHILGEELKEETILESIDKIKADTELKLQDSREIIDKLYEKRFTYEMLSKYDPKNAIMGLYTSCCGTITGCLYGADIAKASIIKDDVQNLVIRNYNGDIIAKGTIYLNKKQGFAVINDFELNDIYKNNEHGIGFYNVKKGSTEEQDRELIFKAFMRGINAFVTKYDEQNPDKTIRYVAVGLGHNRLQAQCEKFKDATNVFSVPEDYQFCDAQDAQKILYDRIQHLKEKARAGDEK